MRCQLEPQSRETSDEESLETAEDILLTFSVPSNTLFLLGSTCYLILAGVDLEWENIIDGLDGNASDISNWDHFYTNVGIIGATLFTLNAVVDFSRCVHISKTFQLSLCHEDLRADSSSAFLFGCAAFLDLWFALPSHQDAWFVTAFGMISAHIYFFSAISAMTGLAFDRSSKVVILNFMGDIMFMVGSLIDLVISYISGLDICVSTQRILLVLSLLSSILWFADACLYLLADFFFWRQSKNHASDSADQDLLAYILEVEPTGSDDILHERGSLRSSPINSNCGYSAGPCINVV